MLAISRAMLVPSAWLMAPTTEATVRVSMLELSDASPVHSVSPVDELGHESRFHPNAAAVVDLVEPCEPAAQDTFLFLLAVVRHDRRKQLCRTKGIDQSVGDMKAPYRYWVTGRVRVFRAG